MMFALTVSILTRSLAVDGLRRRNETTSLTSYRNGVITENPATKSHRVSKAGTLLESGSEEPHCWWTTIKTIVENDYNLAAGRYKPQIAEKAPDDDPSQLIRETLGH